MRSLFNFTSRERNGIIILVLLIAFATFIKLWMAFDSSENEIIDNQDIISLINTFENHTNLQHYEYHDISPQFLAQDLYETTEMFYFDPNTATEQDLLKLDIDENIVRTILNYRRKGGTFHTRDELQKIYGLSNSEYNRLAPYIKINKSQEDVFAENSDIGYAPLKIELNIADTNDLMKLKGIGSVLSKRIVKYRALLGGFCNITQLKEVYGISDSLFTRLSQSIIADTSIIEKINLNLASEAQLSKHPYIGRYHAKGIIQYRQHIKKITDFEELILNNLLPEEHLDKTRKYVTY